MEKTGERIDPDKIKSKRDYIMYLRHLAVYQHTTKIIKKDSRIAEIGFGEGYGSFYLAENGYCVDAWDVEPEVVTHAQKKYQRDSCSFCLYDGEKIEVSDELYDAVVSFQVIEHVKNTDAYLSEIWRILKKGGVFLLSTPNSATRLERGEKPWNPYHYREYYPDELRILLKQNFSDVSVNAVTASAEIYDDEMQRIAETRRNIAIARADILGIRKLLPAGIKTRLKGYIKEIFRKSKKKNISVDFRNLYDIKDFRIVDDSVNAGLDLFVIAVK